MEKKEKNSFVVVAVTVATVLIAVAGGVACFKLNQARNREREALSEARKQAASLNQTLSSQRTELSQEREKLAAVTAQLAAVNEKLAAADQKLAVVQSNNSSLTQKLNGLQTRFSPERVMPQLAQPIAMAGPGDVAAADSVEGKLRVEGKQWEKAPGEITIGSYVEDTLKGRFGQPKGRGWIGKVQATAGQGATVDFGRGCVVGICYPELALVRIVGPELR